MLGIFIFCAAAILEAQAAVEVGNWCYSKKTNYTIIFERASWFEAFEACERLGLELVSITSQSEEDAIELTLGNYTNPIGAGFWTSGTSLASPSFAWFTRGSELVYTNFPPDQPDFPHTEKCIELFRNSKGIWKWNNHECPIKHPYICQTKRNCCYFELEFKNVENVELS